MEQWHWWFHILGSFEIDVQALKHGRGAMHLFPAQCLPKEESVKGKVTQSFVEIKPRRGLKLSQCVYVPAWDAMMSEGHRSWGNVDYYLYCLCFCSANSTCSWTSLVLAWANRPRPASWGYSAATCSSIFQPLLDKKLWDLDNVNKAWGQRFVVQEPTENSLTPPPSSKST